MAYTIWSAITLIFLPVGGIVALCILSGFELLEKLGQQACRIRFEIGSIKIRLPLFIVLICGCCFCGEWIALIRLRERREQSKYEPLEFNESWRALLWRHQRNWWLAIACLFLWLIVWRLSSVIEFYRRELKFLKQENKAVQEKQIQEENRKKKATELASTSSVVPPKSRQDKKED